jgi:hypothetical protein
MFKFLLIVFYKSYLLALNDRGAKLNAPENEVLYRVNEVQFLLYQ